MLTALSFRKLDPNQVRRIFYKTKWQNSFIIPSILGLALTGFN
ncbi:hypothetical protein CF65_01021 [Aggregatibacter actinomycetemcomitans HK1651]|nr:hypothetical protein CF65_01021 [Aggregatibacter actinomycetemcomitans HK1651]